MWMIKENLSVHTDILTWLSMEAFSFPLFASFHYYFLQWKRYFENKDNNAKERLWVTMNNSKQSSHFMIFSWHLQINIDSPGDTYRFLNDHGKHFSQLKHWLNRKTLKEIIWVASFLCNKLKVKISEKVNFA